MDLLPAGKRNFLMMPAQFTEEPGRSSFLRSDDEKIQHGDETASVFRPEMF
jgi:hypothetical protein